MMRYKQGFTLIEMVLSLALVSVIVAFSVPVFRTLLFASDLNATTDMLVHSLRRAQNMSRSVKYDQTWGVKLVGDEIVVFAGDNYIARNVDFDEVYAFSGGISFTGDDEFVFSKMSGYLVTSGTISLTNSFGSNTVSVTELGRIDY